ncbi:hypothetical protein PG913_10745 [Tenacibaculum pacificus]|uniref:hypothetical protein n=1 Tax=Tenacibaculum pacificus TaxID=3018314 RepID=UPI0022F38954|nr:hypothetical protein [Tenacibaculum pacificus]WBX73319.1 hypothetical protein PG913_10745 [Tenacibaculum pacificus]
MNYNQLILKERNFDNEFITFINSYQNLYQNEILKNTPYQTEEKNNHPNLKKRKLKETLEDFFFAPKYNNVLDLLKLSNSN